MLFSRVSLEMTASFKVEKRKCTPKGKRFKCDYNNTFIIYSSGTRIFRPLLSVNFLEKSEKSDLKLRVFLFDDR